jgi:hypothetical protein
LSEKISFYSAGLKLNEEEQNELIYDPVRSLPPMVRELLPDISIVLVPHLEGVVKPVAAPEDITVVLDAPREDRKAKPKERIWQTEMQMDGSVILTFAVQGCDSGEYHYRFFHSIATKVAERSEEKMWDGFRELLRDELRRKVHGEVDEESWRAKDDLLARTSTPWRESKQFRSYARISLVDTLTLYLHGLCCDIDIDPGPRQIQSRELRKRLDWLFTNVGAPQNYYIFPEQKKS